MTERNDGPSMDALADDFGGLDIRVNPLPSTAGKFGGFTFRQKRILSHHNGLEVFLINTAVELEHLVTIATRPTVEHVAIDLEGVNLGGIAPSAETPVSAAAGSASMPLEAESPCAGQKGGEIVLFQLSFQRQGPVFIVDVFGLTPAVAFHRETPSLYHILTSPSLTKLFFDVRADVAALYHGHGIMPAHPIQDMQLWDILNRLLHGRPTERVSGYGLIIEKTRHARLSKQEAGTVPAVKAQAIKLFAPDKGGSWEVWKQRPLPTILLEYCTDARFLFSLSESYGSWKGGRFESVFGEALQAAVDRRLELCQREDYPVLKADKSRMVASDPMLLEQATQVWEAWRKANPGR